MKALYVFVLSVGLCLANEGTHPDSGHPSNFPAPKPPTVPGNTAPLHEKVEKTEIPVSHNGTEQHSTTEETATKKTTPNPTPAPAPTPTPKPNYNGVGKWNVTDDKGHVCILLRGNISLKWVDKKVNETVTIRVPSNAPNHGNCEKKCIEFDLPNNSSLHLMFVKNAASKIFYLGAIKANLQYQTLNASFFNESLHLFENPLDKSYLCLRESQDLVAQQNLQSLTLEVNDFQVQAFKNSTTKDFDADVNCEASHTPDIVPIIVGCALAVLVVLVLVAYLISRRRSQSRGYLSM